MEKYTTGLLANMHLELQKAALGAANNLQLAERSFRIVESHIEKLKEYILSYQFKDKEEEIRFFKEIKPQFKKEQIYYSELFSIEEDKPQGSKKKQKQYYNQCLTAIEVYFDRNQKLYSYYRSSRADSDEIYFLRQATWRTEQLIPIHDVDRNFATPYSNTFSVLQAYEMLREYLNRAMEFESKEAVITGEKKKRNVTWTDSKAALIELVYALHSRGSVNFGNITVKQLVDDLEDFFNISLGNVYTGLLAMGIRKKGRTPYLDSLKQSLENRLDDRDM
jgi:hypothetical protein